MPHFIKWCISWAIFSAGVCLVGIMTLVGQAFITLSFPDSISWFSLRVGLVIAAFIAAWFTIDTRKDIKDEEDIWARIKSVLSRS